MTIEEKMSEIISKKLQDGTIEKIVEEKLTAAIDSAVSDIFRWGDGEKAIKEKLKQVMVPVIEKHNFNDYTLKLDTILTEIINNTTLSDNKDILESFKELMIEPDIKTIDVSEIFEHYKKHVAQNVDTDGLEAMCEDGDPYYEYVDVGFDVEEEESRWSSSSYNHATVRFYCEHDEKEELEYSLKLFKRSNEKEWMMLNTHIKKEIDINSLKNLSNFEIFILRLDRAFVHVVIDNNSDTDEIEPDAKPEWDLS